MLKSWIYEIHNIYLKILRLILINFFLEHDPDHSDDGNDQGAKSQSS
jgi:hypothetical protein